MTLSRQLVRRLRSLSYDDIPDAIREKALLQIADAVGVALAASTSAIAAPYLKFAATVAVAGRSTSLADGRRVDATLAALVNGGLIHSLEFDDTHTASIIHGSSVVLSAALAMVEEQGLRGSELVRLYVLGYEALIRLGLAAPGAPQSRGFQVTALGGCLVAAALAGEAQGLDEDGVVAAVGIALSMASGSMEFLSNGSTVKSLHPGWAAHSGLMAARLAKAGLNGPQTALEGRFGFYALFASEAANRTPVDFASLGEEWRIADVAVKFRPACHYLHAFIECVELLRRKGIGAADIDRFVCLAPAGAAGVVCEPWAEKQRPASGHALRWSLPAIVASAFVDGTIGLHTFEHPPSAATLALAAKGEWFPLEASRFPVCYDARIRCWTVDSRCFEVAVDDAYGNASRPASSQDCRAKFIANASRRLGAEGASVLSDVLARIPTAREVELWKYLRRAA